MLEVMRALVRLLVLAGVGLAVVASSGYAQRELAEAAAAYQELEYERAIALANQALNGRLDRDGQIAAYEILAYAYGALDSVRLAVEAFGDLIFIAPDREPDPISVSPRITSLYASALGQVLVIRKARVDSTTFLAGSGDAALRFEVSQPAVLVARTADGRRIDSLNVAGQAVVRWDGLDDAGMPVPPGVYTLVLQVTNGRDEYVSELPVAITHGAVDTLGHLRSVPGYALQEEMQRPPRNWKPLGLSVLYTGIATGASLALESSRLSSPPRAEIGAVSFAVLVAGFVMSLRPPDPEPVAASILYNRLLREELDRRNGEISDQNMERRRQVLVTVVPAGDGSEH